MPMLKVGNMAMVSALLPRKDILRSGRYYRRKEPSPTLQAGLRAFMMRLIQSNVLQQIILFFKP
jgi:hypothetical protein